MPKAKKLPSGSWNCRVFDHYEYKDGKKIMIRRSFTVDDPTPTGRRRCEAMAAAWAESRKGSAVRDMTVYNAIRKYIDTKRGVLSPSTVSAYESYLRSGGFKMIENKNIRQLKQTDVQLWVSSLAADHSAKYIKNLYLLYLPAVKLFGGFEYEITLPRGRRKQVYTPTDADLRALLEYLGADDSKRDLRAAVLLAAFGSMRRSEICALAPADFSGNVVNVNKAMVRDGRGGWTIKGTKTEDSSRRVVLPVAVLDMIPLDGPQVVACNPDALTNRFRRAVKYAGLPPFSFHALRHYYVSAAHALNIADAYTMKMGGWRTDHVMKSHYRATLSDVEKREQKKLDRHTSAIIGGLTAHETAHERRKIQ